MDTHYRYTGFVIKLDANMGCSWVVGLLSNSLSVLISSSWYIVYDWLNVVRVHIDGSVGCRAEANCHAVGRQHAPKHDTNKSVIVYLIARNHTKCKAAE